MTLCLIRNVIFRFLILNGMVSKLPIWRNLGAITELDNFCDIDFTSVRKKKTQQRPNPPHDHLPTRRGSSSALLKILIPTSKLLHVQTESKLLQLDKILILFRKMRIFVKFVVSF